MQCNHKDCKDCNMGKGPCCGKHDDKNTNPNNNQNRSAAM